MAIGSIPGFFGLSDETLNLSPQTIFQDKLLTRKYCDKAGDHAVPKALSPRNEHCTDNKHYYEEINKTI